MAANVKAHGPPPLLTNDRPDLDTSRAPNYFLERKTRFELATPSLARTCSTTEPLPLSHQYTPSWEDHNLPVDCNPASA